jgi:hypothetical protein
LGNLCCSVSGNAETIPQPREIELPKITPEWAPNTRNALEIKEKLNQNIPSTANFNIIINTRSEPPSVILRDAQLPAYSLRPPLTLKMLDVLKKANKLQMFGIKGAFNIFRQRHFYVWIDSNYMLTHDTKSAIQLVAVNLLQVAKAIDCDFTIFFTGYPNKRSPQLSYKDKARLQALDELWVTQSWQ